MYYLTQANHNESRYIITLLFLTDRFLCDDIFAFLCDRVLFKQPQSSDELIYKEIINGVYVKTNKVVDNFPLYVNERGSIYFQYNKYSNIFYFSKPFPGESYYLGLGAEADFTKITDSKYWVKKADKENNIFGGVVTKWFQYLINQNVYLKENLHIACTNSTDCLFRDLTFNYNIPYINDPMKDYFSPLDNLYLHNRQVYKHSEFHLSTWYLYHSDSSWNIGPDFTSNLVYWTVFDYALKPEFITNVWQKYNGQKWEEQVGVTFQCRGLNKPCSNDRCTKNGVCNLNQLNRTSCTCFFNYTGDDCSKKSVTCKSDIEEANNEAGSLTAYFCLKYYNFYDVLCTKTVSGEYAWSSNESCKVPTTTTKTATTATATTTETLRAKTTSKFTLKSRVVQGKIFNADEFYWIEIVAIVLVSTLPIFGPFMILLLKVNSSFWRITSLWWYFSKFLLIIYAIAIYKM